MNINDDRLEDLLRAAHRAAAPPPEVAPDLPERVRRLHRRTARTRRMLAAGSLAAVLVVAAASAWWLRGAGQSGGLPLSGSLPVARAKSPQEDIAQIKAEIARLDAEAQRRQENVRRAIRASSLPEPTAHAAPEYEDLGPLALARIEHEKTAFLMVDYAEQMARRPSPPAALPVGEGGNSPADEYRRVVELFPETRAAQVARARLHPHPEQ